MPNIILPNATDCHDKDPETLLSLKLNLWISHKLLCNRMPLLILIMNQILYLIMNQILYHLYHDQKKKTSEIALAVHGMNNTLKPT